MANNRAREIVSTVTNLFGVEKVSWARNMKLCNQCLQDGFTEEDIIKAAVNMSKLDKKYWSTYSLFSKIDYWLAQTKEEKTTPKGTW